MNIDFPFKAAHPELVYLDNAASTQIAQPVLDAINKYYVSTHANVHRGAHERSLQATQLFEDARHKLQAFIQSPQPENIIWTSGCTEAINLVAQSWGTAHIRAGDEIAVSGLEHHSNLVPWQRLCEQTGAILKSVSVNKQGALTTESIQSALTENTRVLAVAHVSNVTGTIHPIKQWCKLARANGTVTMIDGAQAVAHIPVDVTDLNCDFYAFSGHKMYGPTGIGVLYGKTEHLSNMAPWQSGGGMVTRVYSNTSQYAPAPLCFEAGTPAIAQAIGMGAAANLLTPKCLKQHHQKQSRQLDRLRQSLAQQPRIKTLGNNAEENTGILSFTVDKAHAFDIATLLNEQHIAARSGHLCAMPLLKALHIDSAVRLSLAMYNTDDDIDRCVEGITQCLTLL